MSTNKKYFYLKLKDNFFDREEIKILEKQENGYLYSNLYLKLCLMSLKGEGRLLFRDEIPYDEGMISTITGLPLDSVRAGVVILQKFGLLKRMECGEIYMADIQSMIGRSSTEADRKIEFRKRMKGQKEVGWTYDRDSSADSPEPSALRTPEIELELETELELKKEIETELKTEIETKKKKLIHQTDASNKNKDAEKIKNMPIAISIAQFFYDKIMQEVDHPQYRNNPPDLDTWAKHIEYMLRLDKLHPDEIKRVISWTLKDPFWRTNVLCPENLRKKYGTLYLKMKNGNGRRNSKTPEQLYEENRRLAEEIIGGSK